MQSSPGKTVKRAAPHRIRPRKTWPITALAFWLWAVPFACDSLFGWASSAAHAESGKGKDGSGDRDNSGSGGSGGSSDNSGSGGDDHDDRTDDSHDDDDAGQQDRPAGNDQRETITPPTRTQNGDRPEAGPVTATLHLLYMNGWQERVAGGRYRLTDPKGRVVKDRAARPQDLIRMRAQLNN